MKLVPAEEAFAARAGRRAFSIWPRAGEKNRLFPEAWPILHPKFTFDDVRTIYTIGSCFARNIEEELTRFGFELPMLDFAVTPEEYPFRANGIVNKYTVPSILSDFEWTVSVRDARTEEERRARLTEPLVGLGDDVVDLDLAGYRPVSRSRAIERREQLFKVNLRAFDADIVVMTFGLLESWWDAERARFIQQTPSPQLIAAYPGRFHFTILSFHEAYDFAKRSIDFFLQHGNPAAKFLITTSPVPLRYSFSGEDVLIANTYAKATLRSVCGQLVREYAQVDYFPSFESVTLSRSPDVWMDDLTHVQDAFVGKIVAQLQHYYFPSRQPTQPRREAKHRDAVAG